MAKRCGEGQRQSITRNSRARVPSRRLPLAQALCIGTAAFDVFLTVDGFPQENRKYELQDSREEGGGPAANAACLLARWGVSAALACVLGDDLFGSKIIQELRAAGADLSLTEVRPGYRTALSVILVNSEGGSRTILNRLEPGEPLRLDAAAAQAANPRVLLFDGHQPEASMQALAMFPQAVSVLDAGSRRRGTELLAPRVDYLVASEAFGLAMSGVRDLDSPEGQRECLRRLREQARGEPCGRELAGPEPAGTAAGRGQVAVTLGERGVIFLEHGRLRRLPAEEVRVMDTTAAGDVFHGAFVYGLLSGLDFPEALAFSNRAAGLSVTRPGGRSSIPHLRELGGSSGEGRGGDAAGR